MKQIIIILLLAIGAFAQNKIPECYLSVTGNGLINTTIQNGKCVHLTDANDTVGIYPIKNGIVNGDVIYYSDDVKLVKLYKNGYKVDNKKQFSLDVPDDVREYNDIQIDSIESIYSDDINGILMMEIGYYKGIKLVEVQYSLSDDNILYIRSVGINAPLYKIFYKSYEFTYTEYGIGTLMQIFNYYECNVTNYDNGIIKSIRKMNITSVGCHT